MERRLTGICATLYNYILNKSNEQLETDYIFSDEFYSLGVKPSSLKTSLQNLQKKGYIQVLAHTNGGRGISYRKFKVLKKIIVENPPISSRENKKELDVISIKPRSLTTNLYFICNEKETIVKIGISDNIDKRLRQHQTSNSEKLKIMRVINTVPAALEKEIHEEFDHLRKEGEWFTLNKELKMYIQYMRIPECFLNVKL